LTVVATQNDVMRVAGDGETRESGHWLMVIRTRPQLTPRVFDLFFYAKCKSK
jgi:hypothetical protein